MTNTMRPQLPTDTSSIVNNVVYVDGRPTAATQLGLHELAVEDAVTARQRPKLERYGDTLFVVLRSAHYRDDTEEVDFGELHLFVGPNFVLTVRHSEAPDLAAVRQRVENQPQLLQRYLRDVADHITVVVEQADSFRGMLADILTVNTTLVTQAQNEEMQRLAEACNAQNEQLKRSPHGRRSCSPPP